ncbi:sialoadhesin-like [Fundulus diaphanus]
MFSTHASLTVSPGRSQFFEYETVSISCEQFGPGPWTVWTYTEPGLEMSQCVSKQSSSCTIKNLKPLNTGVYWCESRHRDSSNAVNISVTNGDVILESPVLPVKPGHNVTLSCKHKLESSDKAATFFKNGSLIGAEPTGQLTLHNVSRATEGGYQCQTNGATSPTSWLLIEDVSKPASLTVDPDVSQLFEYDYFSLSCGIDSSSQGWTIKRVPANKTKVSSCDKPTSSGCSLQRAKPSDSGLYWCESPSRQRSNTVSITVYDRALILVSPALPVTSGANVTLTCRSRTPQARPARFYRDGSWIRTEPSGQMTLHPVSTSDEGLYKCSVDGQESPSSWLFVRASDVHSSPAISPLQVISHIAAWSSYIYPTYAIISRCRARPKGRAPAVPDPTSAEDHAGDYDDVVAEVTTEHRF